MDHGGGGFGDGGGRGDGGGSGGGGGGCGGLGQTAPSAAAEHWPAVNWHGL